MIEERPARELLNPILSEKILIEETIRLKTFKENYQEKETKTLAETLKIP